MGGKVLLFVLAGVLVGGTWSLHSQKFPKVAVVITGLLAALALTGALLWQF